MCYILHLIPLFSRSQPPFHSHFVSLWPPLPTFCQGAFISRIASSTLVAGIALHVALHTQINISPRTYSASLPHAGSSSAFRVIFQQLFPNFCTSSFTHNEPDRHSFEIEGFLQALAQKPFEKAGQLFHVGE